MKSIKINEVLNIAFTLLMVAIIFVSGLFIISAWTDITIRDNDLVHTIKDETDGTTYYEGATIRNLILPIILLLILVFMSIGAFIEIRKKAPEEYWELIVMQFKVLLGSILIAFGVAIFDFLFSGEDPTISNIFLVGFVIYFIFGTLTLYYWTFKDAF